MYVYIYIYSYSQYISKLSSIPLRKLPSVSLQADSHVSPRQQLKCFMYMFQMLFINGAELERTSLAYEARLTSSI